jgi:hypothetical protein
MAGRSRVNREVHARICGSVGVRFPCATRHIIVCKPKIRPKYYFKASALCWAGLLIKPLLNIAAFSCFNSIFCCFKKKLYLSRRKQKGES